MIEFNIAVLIFIKTSCNTLNEKRKLFVSNVNYFTLLTNEEEAFRRNFLKLKQWLKIYDGN